VALIEVLSQLCNTFNLAIAAVATVKVLPTATAAINQSGEQHHQY
jgi:hypothetical protein